MSFKAPPQPTSARRFNALIPLLCLLAARLALGAVYSLVVPIWESYDEDGHFAYARYIATHRSLLKPGDPAAEQVWEKFQPPLYYILVAPLIAGFDLGAAWQAPAHNPYFVRGDAGRNYALHPDALTGAAQQIEWGVRVARLFSVTVTTLGVACVFLAARLLWPAEKNKVWAATCLYAFWPQFLFNGSMVTNDALVSALAAGLLYVALRLTVKGFSWRWLMGLGALWGAALLTKLNALALLPVVVGALWLSLGGAGHKSPARWLALAGMGLVAAAALGLISSLRFVTQQVFQIKTAFDFIHHLANLASLAGALNYSFRTFAGSFGWGNLEAAPWLYQLWAALAGLAGLGLLWGGLRRRLALKSGPLALIGLQALLVFGLSLALAIASQTIHLTHGRYLLPALPAVCFLLISGWQALLPRRWQPYAWKLIGLGIMLIGWFIPFTTLAYAYAKPLPATPDVAQAIQPIQAILDDRIELVGYLPPQPVSAGESIRLSLCWRAIKPVTKDYSVILNAAGPDGQGYGELRTYPGRGNYPTSFWTVNTLFCDRYTVPVGSGFPAPAIGQLHVGLLDAGSGQWLAITALKGQPVEPKATPAPPVANAGQHIYLPLVTVSSGGDALSAIPLSSPDPILIPFKIKPGTHPAAPPMHGVEYHFGQALILRGYDMLPLAGDRPGIKVVLHWEVVKTIRDSDVVFVHLRDTPTHAYAQDDSQPREGWYPTQWWEAGETVLDEHNLYLPAGAPPPLDLYVGLYDPAANARVPAFDAHGQAVPNNEIILAQSLALP